MKAIKQLLITFVVGGVFAVIGQGIMSLYAILLGNGAILIGPLTLATLGLLGAILFIPGYYQKIEKIAGFGAILPFSGLTAAVAGAFADTREKGVTIGKASKAGALLLAYVVCIGGLLCVIVGFIAHFITG